MSFAAFLNRWLRRYSPRQQKRRPFVKQKPAVEYLENRTLLNVASVNPIAHPVHPIANPFYVPPNVPGEHYVTGLYYDVLQRQPAQWEVKYWTARMDGTASNREVIARSFVDSVENQSNMITADYQTLLGRAPEPGAVDYWLARIHEGLSTQQLLAKIISSGEYYGKQGGTTSGWLSGVYRDLFGRSPDAAGFLGWSHSLQDGAPREAVALGFVNSPEEFGRQVDQAFHDLLGRPADDFGMKAFTAAMQHGATLDQMHIGIADSGEYFGQQQGVDLPTIGQPKPSADPGPDVGGQPAGDQGGNSGSNDNGGGDTNPGDTGGGQSGGGDNQGGGTDFGGQDGGPTGVGVGGPGGDTGNGGMGGGDNGGGGLQGGGDGGNVGLGGGGDGGGGGLGGGNGGGVGLGGGGNLGGGNGGGIGLGGGGNLGGGDGGGGGAGGGNGGQGGGGGIGQGGGGGGGGVGQGGGGGGLGGGGGSSGGQGSSGSGSVSASTGPGAAGPIVNVTNDPANDWAEIAMDVNPKNPNNIVIFGTRVVSVVTCDAYYTFNGGKTWTDVRVDNAFDGITGANTLRGDPTVAFDANGRLYISYLVDGDNSSATAGNTYLVVAHSTDGGKTYNAVIAVQEAKTGSVFDDKELLGVGPAPGNPKQQNVYLGYTRFANTGLANQTNTAELIGSTDGGVTWSSPTNVGDAGDTNVQFVTPRVGPDGQIYVSFVQNNDIEIKASQTFSGGKFNFPADTKVLTTNETNFTNIIPAQPNRGITVIPVLAVDDSPGKRRGELYISYADLAAGGSSPSFEIFVVTSKDKGKTWTAPKKVNDDSGPNSHFNPWIVVDQTTGCPTLEWRDARNDPNNNKVDVFTSTSMDGGATFSKNVKVTAAPSFANSTTYIGDYLEYDGLAAFSGTAYYAWSDNSNSSGNKSIFFTSLATGCAPITGGGGGEVLPDPFEADTSDQAFQLGTLNGSQKLANITLANDANALPDYDWFMWTAGKAGTFNAKIDYTTFSGGDLHMRVFTILGNNLAQVASSRQQGVTSQQIAVAVNKNEPVLVWIYGFDHEQGTYTLNGSIT